MNEKEMEMIEGAASRSTVSCLLGGVWGGGGGGGTCQNALTICEGSRWHCCY